MSTKTEFILSAKDETKAAFDSASRNLDGLGKKVSGISSSFKDLAKLSLAGFSIAGLAGFVKSAIDAQDSLKDLSKSTSISIEDLAGLSSAAQKSGGDLDSIAGAINKLSVNIGKEPEKFKAIGVSAKDPIEAFKQLADVFVSIQDPQERAAFGAAALGKSWAGAAPLLSEGSKAIGEMVEKGKSLSKNTKEASDRADELNAKLTDLKQIAGGVSVQFANLLVPSLTDTASAMETLASKGNPVLAILRGFAGLGKIPFDLALGSIDTSVVGQIKDLESELSKLKTKQSRAGTGGGGIINDWVFGKKGEFDQQILVVTNQLEALKKYGDVTKKAAVTTTGESKPAPDIRAFIGGGKTGGSSGRSSGGSAKPKAEPYTDPLAASAKAFAKALEDLDKTMLDTDKSTLTLNKSQEILFDLMRSPLWEKMPDTWKDITIAQVEAGTAAIESAENIKKLNDILAETPTEKLEKQRETMLFLADAYNAGSLSVEQFTEAVDVSLNRLPEAAKEATDAMSEFAAQAARNMQDAFADFLFDPFKGGLSGMLQSFATMLQKMIANAVAADLAKSMFGKAAGGEGGGWLGAGFSWLENLVKNADGGVYASPGLSSYSGSIVSQPTLFKFAKGIGMMGEAGAEAILPLSRGANGKLGVVAQGAWQGHNITINISGNSSAPDVRRAAGQGAREAMAAINGARRYA